MTKIYFAGSIRGGRDDRELYHQIITYLQSKGEVLTEHVGNSDLSAFGETTISDREIYQRDMAWLMEADVIIAEVTCPSLGVGFEIATAIGAGKKILCLYRTQEGKRLSPMLSGCDAITVREYTIYSEIEKNIDAFLVSVE
jgi:2'-deoxynucleoside 5'-phosphate N-hydrolase